MPDKIQPHNHLTRLLIGVSIIILICIGLIIGYFWYLTKISNQPKPDFCCQLHQSNKVSTTASNSDWKTYRNPKYGYEISYPKSLESSRGIESDINDEVFSILPVIEIKPITSSITDPNTWWNNQPNDPFFHRDKTCYSQSKTSLITSRYHNISEKLPTTTLALPYDALILRQTNQAFCNEPPYSQIIILKTSNRQLLSIIEHSSTTGEEILSTFKFTTPNVNTISSWDTYTSNKLGFSFKYPSSLTKKDFSDSELALFAEDKIHEFRINVFTKPSTASVKDFIYQDGIGDSYGKAYQDQSGGDYQLSFKIVDSPNNLKIWTPSDSFPSANGAYTRFIEYQDKLIWFRLEPYLEPNNRNASQIPNQDKYLQIFDQILSTLKFD